MVLFGGIADVVVAFGVAYFLYFTGKGIYYYFAPPQCKCKKEVRHNG